MDQFLIIINQLFQFGVMLTIGYVSAKLQVLTVPSLKLLARLIMNVLLPILIFANATNGTGRINLIESYPIIFLSLGMYAGLIVSSIFLVKVSKIKSQKAGVYRASMIFGNAGFIGIPLLINLFPENGAIYIALMSSEMPAL